LQVDIHKIKFFYMEDDGGSAVVSAVHPEIKTALRKVILHLDKAYGIKAHKVNNKWSISVPTPSMSG
jgi:fatty acid amide hydrolase 2